MADDRVFELRREDRAGPTCPRGVRARAYAIFPERAALREATQLRRLMPDAALPALRGKAAPALQRFEARGVRIDLQVRTTQDGTRTLDLVVEAAPAGARLRVCYPPAARERLVRTDRHGVGSVAVPARARECILSLAVPQGRTWRTERIRLG